MHKVLLPFLALSFCLSINSQTNSYKVSFDNAVHHEGVFTLSFPEITSDTLSVRMANSSPGRYAFHSFAKNVYSFKAMDSKGKTIPFHRPNPYQWDIYGHDGEVTIQYTLFANRGDGTFSQIDETHAHLNIPASFIYAPALSNRPIEISFNTPETYQWKVATQLKKHDEKLYWAPNLYYFMDSPIELSNHSLREFKVNSNGKNQNIRFVLHHNGTEEELNQYFESVKLIVKEQEKVFGELPNFDFGEYTFLACYMPNVNGDGMEHRNSTILTSTRSLANEGLKRNLGTVSHEFFHAWNVERIRPKPLEPFDFDNVDMSGELWFAEGFTSYYTNLILCRAGLRTPEEYVKGLNGAFNYVWNSNGTKFFNPIKMSYQAPFVDAATSLDPQNRNNTFISYYSYGSVLGLALDLSLRKNNLNLDDFFKKVWNTFGKNEKPYTITDLHLTLNEYAGKSFGDSYFENYIYNSNMPDYKTLFASVGLKMTQDEDTGYFGGYVNKNTIGNNTLIDSPAYKAGLERGDVITKVNTIEMTEENHFSDFLKTKKQGDTLAITYTRFGKERKTEVTLSKNPKYTISIDTEADEKAVSMRNKWLKQ
ncbi:M61 family metallopeptidase [Croceitalea sp. MTPC9]|uniref:M61 family metallopeptidase n=1 Tax=unclassified Croceitalea TaxID=2632280 RepID=UPI002B37658B|nr:M61 family metallopeptidase [Croceitalea sp. MTPC6]GMN15431.1 M61 family metallopeptidase [Croceitalea sp. MTPC9]